MSFPDIVYIVSAVLLAIYGFNSLVLVGLYLRHRRERQPCPPLTAMPTVTVQLPIYNELYVVQRLIDAVAALDYPRSSLQIQVLDDSDDETTALAGERVAYHRRRGLDIELIHRPERVGFKAGALREGLETARGEFIAIFDADFVPRPDFLHQTVPHFLDRPNLGLIQTRWGHLNADYSFLTRAQAIALDGHFVVEQVARQRSGLFMNFNGTAGLWRRACILEAGHWQGDTLSEDLDLSYRAQLRGWEFLFLPEVVAPAELPPQINAFKRQQFRWAKGSTQCVLKLWPQIVTAKLPFFKRLEGLLHLTSYFVHPLLLLLLLSGVPAMLGDGFPPLPLAYLSLASLGPPLLYALSQRALYPDWRRRFAHLPLLILLGTGIALSNTCAIYEALTRRGNLFRRTPKFRLEGQQDAWRGKRYALPRDRLVVGEVLLGLYALGGALAAWWEGKGLLVPFLLFYALAFGYVSSLTTLHSRLQGEGESGQPGPVSWPRLRQEGLRWGQRLRPWLAAPVGWLLSLR